MESNPSLEERLQSFPELQSRMARIIDIAENANGDLIRADDVEERVTEEIQKLAQEVIQGWAEKESERQAEAFQSSDHRSYNHGKKNSTGKRNTEGSMS